MNNYICKKCATLVQKDTMPNSSNCPSGSSHSWNKIGEVGDKNYQCKKCTILVKSKLNPTSANCPSGGSHSWNKL